MRKEKGRKQTFSLALITGATSGIGEALARFYAKKNVSLLLVGRNKERLSQMKKELGAETFVCDLSHSDQREKILQLIEERCPDLVVNAAGFGHYLEALDYPLEKHCEMIEVNVVSLVALTLTAAKALKRSGRKGTIVNVSSAAAFQVSPFFTTYSSTKAFVRQFSESLHYELFPYGIKVLVSCPGMVKTSFKENAGGKKTVHHNKLGSMSVEYAVKRIDKQILSGKLLDLFDWRYKVLTTLAHFLPRRVVAFVMKKAIQRQV